MVSADSSEHAFGAVQCSRQRMALADDDSGLRLGDLGPFLFACLAQ